MRKTLFAVLATVCSLCVPKLQAQDASSAPRPSITVTKDSTTIYAPYFSTPNEVFRADDGWIHSAMQRVVCNDSAAVSRLFNGSMTYATFRSRLNSLPQKDCGEFPANTAVVSTIEVLHSLPSNEDRSKWHTASATQFRVQHMPLERAGNDANPDVLATQASQPSYQRKIREILSKDDATELIDLIIAKKGVPMELQTGDPILINFGTNGVHGSRIEYVTRDGEKPFRVLMFRMQSGLVLYIAESCSNPLFPLQAATYSVTLQQPKIGIEKFVLNLAQGNHGWTKYLSFDGTVSQNLQYLIVVRNNGTGVATGVKLTDQPPAHIQLDPSSPLANGGKLIGELASGMVDTTIVAATYVPFETSALSVLMRNYATVETSNAGSAKDNADVEALFRQRAAPPPAGPPPKCFRGAKSTLECLGVACILGIVGTAIVDDQHRFHPLCGFLNWGPPEGCVDTGNKPCDKPITRVFNIVPVGNAANFNVGWQPTPIPESVRHQKMVRARVGVSILTKTILRSLRK